ncbi:gephyrin-like molybdotransferase Glp [Desulfosediminicola ganghwensis]|uniref:molybdopterin molybdotransferase MoeA n=1 Tax=Desulfosediminicola ganghwensis TaxID=2569540 RepID=UPI0010AB8B44|nr:gephyrin-like molybdotransferase Glp [Desulfosediminicola ganghwensis]
MTSKPQTRDMLGRTTLTPVPEARSILLDQLQKISPETETIRIEDGLDRVLAQSIFSAENLPPHPRSVMDGFAVCAADTFGASESMPCYLQITGNVAMGEMPVGEVQRGCCFKIATGGFLPKGADAVIMHEHTVPVDETMIEIVKGGGPGTAIIGVGDDIREGEEALKPGHLLRPQDLGLLAALGITQIKVYRQVRVGIVSTGDEIVPHSEQPGPGKIRNINSVALVGLISRAGAIPTDYGIVSDQREVFFPVLENALKENDIVLFSGGSSVGVRDLGEQAVESLGPPGILVHGVKLKPGKPVLIGLSGTKPVFGLPGHPVSALVCFDLFVAPAIKQLSGEVTGPKPTATVTAKLSRNLNSAAGRLDLVRVRLIQEKGSCIAEPVMGKSGAISTLSRAHGYFLIDEDSQGVTQDSPVEVYIYS